jgi:hypothetical protein
MMSESARTARDYAEASLRDLTTHYLDLLEASVHARLDGRTATLQHALDRLAISEAISRYVNDGRQVDVLAALNAGASWRSVGDVVDVPVALLRAEFEQWVEGQRALYDALQQERPDARPIGMSPAHGDAALRLAAAAGRDERGYCRG